MKKHWKNKQETDDTKKRQFEQFKTTPSFVRDTMNVTITLNDAQEEQIQLKFKIDNFSSSIRPKFRIKKMKKSYFYKRKLTSQWNTNAY